MPFVSLVNIAGGFHFRGTEADRFAEVAKSAFLFDSSRLNCFVQAVVEYFGLDACLCNVCGSFKLICLVETVVEYFGLEAGLADFWDSSI
jgi:hypothetical protein